MASLPRRSRLPTSPRNARRGQPASQGHRAGGWNLDSSDGFDPAEFAEFLEADDSPMPADPAFKERLRQRLWGMVRDNANASAPPPPSRIGDRARRPLRSQYQATTLNASARSTFAP